MPRTHLTDYLDFHAQTKKDKPALVCNERQFSWSQLRKEVDSAAGFLSEALPADGGQQIVGILLPNGWQFVVAYLAALRLGHMVLPIDPTYKQIEIEAVIKQIPPAAVITNRHYAPVFGNISQPVFLDKDVTAHKGSLDASRIYRTDAKKQIASLVFTSGTTGQPKAAPYTHANHIWNIKACSKVWDWDENDSMLLSLPLAHWYGLVMGLSGILYHGNTLYLHDWFDAGRILDDLATGNISMFTHVPAAYSKILEEKGDWDLAGVRLFISGGSAMPPAVWRAFQKRFGHKILEVYGSSETGRIASNLLNERIPGSPGRVLDDVQLKFDEHHEILVKSPGVFPGYYKNPDANAKSRIEGGWWRTGDIGLLTEERLVLKGRVQEKIRKFNQTISPRDVEWAMHRHPAVRDIHVLGVQQQNEPNDKLIYFIVGDLDADEVRDFCKANLPYPWRPDKVFFVKSLPRAKNGKPQIAKMKEMAGVA